MSLASDGAPGGLRVIVLGYIVRFPVGGNAWPYLQYVMGLAGLGHEVYFAEDSGDEPWSCYDPVRNVTDTDPDYGLRFTRSAFGRLGLGDRWAYYDAPTRRWLGPCAGRILDLCATADVVLNVSGANTLRPWLAEVPTRILIDTDPVFTQVRHLTDPARRQRALAHNAFFSFAENAGSAECLVPDDGFPWQPTRQPVALGAWPITPGPADGKFTTVMQWDSYAALEHEGKRYGMKSDSFSPYFDLPQATGVNLELAVGSLSAPLDLLRGRGWRVVDPRVPTRDPWTYQRYLQDSKGEFGIAKHGYVVTGSGWFSERSADYLASGRPAVLQDTGFSRWLPVGRGVVAFDSPEGAAAALADVNADYVGHCAAARALAEEYFGAEKVLTPLLESALSPAASTTGRGSRR